MAQATPAKLPFSEVLTTDGLLFISGTISPNEPDFESEAGGVMKKIGNILASNGLSYDDLVSVSVFLETMDNYAALNKVYTGFFKDKYPTRTCLAVHDLPLGANVEISAIARLKNKAASNFSHLDYFQVDVFSDKALSGNGLTVFPFAESYSDDLMMKLTREMRQFESIFLLKKNENHYSARIFTMEEELGFAGHPSIGAMCLLHNITRPNEFKVSWTLSLKAKDVTIETEKTATGFFGRMNQGTPVFDRILSKDESLRFLQDMSLDASDWDDRYPLQVVSTGLPYLLIPVKEGMSLKARIAVKDLEKKLASIGARFVGVFEPGARKVRTWDNMGTVEDIATGSLAGPVGAYLVKYKVAQANEVVLLSQGEHLGRPSVLHVEVRTKGDKTEVIVGGSVVMIAKGRLEEWVVGGSD